MRALGRESCKGFASVLCKPNEDVSRQGMALFNIYI